MYVRICVYIYIYMYTYTHILSMYIYIDTAVCHDDAVLVLHILHFQQYLKSHQFILNRSTL